MTPEMLELYSPFNAKNLTQEQIAAMENFTKEDLKALAERWPNTKVNQTYLVLKDRSTKEGKQIAQPSTWPNLYQLHKIGQTQFVAMSYKSIYNPKASTGLKVAPVKDLTATEVKAELTGGNNEKPATIEQKTEAGTATAVTQTAKEATAPKTPAQIAAEEAKNVEGGEAANKEKVVEKPLSRMNLKELQTKYEQVLKTDPDPALVRKDLIAAIEKETAKK